MSISTNKITVTRGDTAQFHFHREDSDGNKITTEPDRLYFTVKNKPQDKTAVFQKTLEDMLFDEDSEYHFIIDPEDTDKMRFGNYYYDIEVIDEGVKTTISFGVFEVLAEVTHSGNEV